MLIKEWDFKEVISVKKMNPKELNNLLRLTHMIHKDKNAARILAATLKKPKPVKEIAKICKIPPTKCIRTIKKLKDNGLIRVTKKVASDQKPNKPILFYKAKLDPRFFRFENGRFRVRFPGDIRLASGKKVDLKVLVESYPKISSKQK